MGVYLCRGSCNKDCILRGLHWGHPLYGSYLRTPNHDHPCFGPTPPFLETPISRLRDYGMREPCLCSPAGSSRGHEILRWAS